MSIFERQFSSSSLTREGSTSMRMRGSRVVFETFNDNPNSRVERAVIQHYSRDELWQWVTDRLAQGETVILHPDTSDRWAQPGNAEDLDK